MERKEQSLVMANLHARLINSDTGEVIKESHTSNTMVDSGLYLLANYMGSASMSKPDHIVLGSNSATATASDTALGTFKFAKTATVSSVSMVTTYKITLSGAEGTCSGGFVYKELGLANASASYVLFNRGLADDLDHTSNTTLCAVVTITYA